MIFLLLFVPQAAQPNTPAMTTAPVRGDRFQLIVPQGWKVLNDGGYVLLEHSSGASLLVERITRTPNLADYAEHQAERIMTPLGFAKLGEPQAFKDTKEEWVQYEIRGNRLTDHRRILYRVIRREANFYEFVLETHEEDFEPLLRDAQGIVSTVQAIAQAPQPVRRTRRVR